MEEELNKKPEYVVEISKKKLTISGVILLILVVAAGWLYISTMSRTFGVATGGANSINVDINPFSEAGGVVYNDRGGKSSVEDTREFMKTSYNGTIKTRDVSSVMMESEGIIRDAGGRIDSINSSEKSGYISFVIPKSNLFEFKYQIEQLTHKKLYVESTSSRNLLNQKQGIENREDAANETLEDLLDQKEELETAHAQRVAAFDGQISDLETAVLTLSSLMPSAGEGEDSEIDWYMSQISSLQSQITQIKRDKSNENNSYNSQRNSLLSRIENAETRLEMIDEEDENFTENIETVNGSLSVRWISLWNVAKEFSPIPMGINLAILIILCWKILQKIRIIPRFRVV